MRTERRPNAVNESHGDERMACDTEEEGFLWPREETIHCDVTAGIDETAFRREYPVIWWLTLVGPFVMTSAVVFLVWEFAGPRVAW